MGLKPSYAEQGALRMPMGFPREALASALDYRAEPHDIFVASYPKCGTTWLQNIVYLLHESNVCTYFHVPPLPNAYRERLVPIGIPLASARLLVVDADGRPASEGELLVAAPTNMREYWDEPQKTAAAFEWRRENGAEVRYLRTGDRVSAGADGNLDFSAIYKTIRR